MFAIQQDRKTVTDETAETINMPRNASLNVTGIPDQMKVQFEEASGMSFDDVRIHYNSTKPAKLNALAYTQGRNIYLGAGQEKHLPHELGHVIQQKRGAVPVNRWLNGLPLNDDTRLEAEADRISRYKAPAQAVGFPSNIVQRKMDVEVALVPREDIERPLMPVDVMIDTIKLSGRADTGLENENGNETQGDHIIADVLVKKYQKVMCRGQVLPNIFNFYKNLANEMRFENAIADGQIQKLSLEQRAKIQQDRILFSNTTAEKMDTVITQGESEIKNIPAWRKHIKEIIRLYNDAYANSYFATHGVGTGGHGEAEAMKYIRDKMSRNTIIQPCFTNKLIDRDSLVRALMDIGYTGANLERSAQIVTNRFCMMLEQMVNYKGFKMCLDRSRSMTENELRDNEIRRCNAITPLSRVVAAKINFLRYGLYYSPKEIAQQANQNRMQDYIRENGYPEDCPEEQVVMGFLQKTLGVSDIMNQQLEFEVCSRICDYLSQIGRVLKSDKGSIYTRKKTLNKIKLKTVKNLTADLINWCESNPVADRVLLNIYEEIGTKGARLLNFIDDYINREVTESGQNEIITILQWAQRSAEICKTLCEQQAVAFDLRRLQ